MQKERIILENGSTVISTSRVVMNGTTYPTANLTSVSQNVEKPGKFFPVIFIIFGLGLLANQEYGWGCIFVAIGVLLLLRKPTYTLIFSTSGNQVPAFQTKDRNWIVELETAINNAIIERG